MVVSMSTIQTMQNEIEGWMKHYKVSPTIVRDLLFRLSLVKGNKSFQQSIERLIEEFDFVQENK